MEKKNMLGVVMPEEQGGLTGPRMFPSWHTAFSYYGGTLNRLDYALYDDT